MAFSAVLLGTAVSIAGFLILMLGFASGPLAAFGFAFLAGQVTTVMFVIKALICQSLRETTQQS